MPRRLRTALVGGVAVLTFAACGGAASTASPGDVTSPDVTAPSPSIGASPSVDVGASPSFDASPSADASPSTGLGGVGASPSASLDTNADPDLAARIPATVGDVTLQVVSLRGADFLAQAPSSDVGDALEQAGADPEDVSVAIGVGLEADTQLVVAAFRVVGADADTLERSFEDAATAGDPNVTVDRITIAGTEVVQVDPGSDALGSILWTEDDTLFLVQTADPQLRNEAVEALS